MTADRTERRRTRELLTARGKAAALENVADACRQVAREYVLGLGLVGEVLWGRRLARQPRLAEGDAEFGVAMDYGRVVTLVLALTDAGPRPTAWTVCVPPAERRFDLDELRAALDLAARPTT